jgi:hypothetical protein
VRTVGDSDVVDTRLLTSQRFSTNVRQTTASALLLHLLQCCFHSSGLLDSITMDLVVIGRSGDRRKEGVDP